VDFAKAIPFIVAGLLLARWLAQLWLEWLNQRQIRACSGAVPETFHGVMDDATYAKSVQYSLTKSRFSQFEATFDLVVLLAVLFSGVLPWALELFATRLGTSAWSMAAYLFIVFVAISCVSLPLQWWDQFRLEERFGFNTTTLPTWWLDRAKGLLLAVVLGCPLLALMLKCAGWAGAWWWVWAWVALLAFQLLMSVLAPVLILPIFNKLTPLPDGSLRERLLALAAKTHFRAASIQIMDGSKRSRHSNAFFTGFGRFRKVVLFDTLVTQLDELELEAVLAHEIGHWKKKHITKMLAMSAAGTLAAFAAIAWLARQDWFLRAFGFPSGGIAPVFLLFGLLAGVLTFWLSPLTHSWSRRHEYEADVFARQTMGGAAPLISALRKLNEKNLANLTPHPVYSRFYYSHPTLLERELALRS
jgi:STE24 endopeptidase